MIILLSGCLGEILKTVQVSILKTRSMYVVSCSLVLARDGRSWWADDHRRKEEEKVVCWLVGWLVVYGINHKPISTFAFIRVLSEDVVVRPQHQSVC